jgi:DNA repair protein RecO (recombination protein O)
MEWQSPAIVLAARPLGETGLVVSLLTEAQGRHAGLAKAGASRAQAALWQPGNLIEARWVARLAEQLGALSGELVHPAAARALDAPLGLALLSAACAMAEAVLPDRAPYPVAFRGLLALIAGLPVPALADYVRWEAALLTELGYGLDLDRCALTGTTDDLAFVSPRSGRAVSAAAAGPWRARLLPLPGFLAQDRVAAAPDELLVGLRLTGHFLARAVPGEVLPAARGRLFDRIADLARAGSLTGS